MERLTRVVAKIRKHVDKLLTSQKIFFLIRDSFSKNNSYAKKYFCVALQIKRVKSPYSI